MWSFRFVEERRVHVHEVRAGQADPEERIVLSEMSEVLDFMDHSREGVRVMPQGRHSPRWLPEIEAVLILGEWQAREHVVKPAA
mgnify:CR=1 FL=1